MSDYRKNFFVDTSFHICHFFDGQHQHEIALRTLDCIKKTYPGARFITTHTIFQETMSLVLHSRTMERLLDKRTRQKYADALCQDILHHCEVRTIPHDMFLETWKLYTSDRARKAGLEYVDCNSFVFIRDIRKAAYEDHRLSFNAVLTFNERHFNKEFGQEFGFKVFDYSIL